MNERNQNAKADGGKPQISLVPPEIMRAIAKIREYGVNKYHNKNNWILVEKDRYVDALMRHLLSYIEGEEFDKESGLPHIWHAACNIAFIIEMEKEDWPEIRQRIIDSDPKIKEILNSKDKKEKIKPNNCKSDDKEHVEAEAKYDLFQMG